MGDDYVHGYSDVEQRRLTLMQTLLNDAQIREMDLSGVRSILDVGSGLGQLARAFARAAGAGVRVIAVERSERQRAEAERQAHAAGDAGRVEFRAGDATALPLADDERGSFDLVHARFLLEHVRDPLAVVREMVGAVRPGGKIVLVDDDHEVLRLAPACPELESAWRVYWEAYADRGQDPLVGRRLPALIHEAGAIPTRVTAVFYGACHGMALFEPVVDNLAAVLDGAAESLATAGRLSRPELDAALAAFARWRRRPAATVWYALPLAEGVKSLP